MGWVADSVFPSRAAAGVHLLSGRWLRPGRRVVVTDKGKALEGSVVAAGNYSDAANHKSFFGQLRVETASEGLDGTQAFAAGYLEGYLTAARISQHYTNMESWWNQKGHEVLSNVTDWLKEQDRFAQLLATEGLGGGDGTAQRLNIVLRQLHGLAAGYSEAVAHGEGLLRPLTYAQLHLLNSVGDLIDLFNKASSPIPWASMEPHEILATISSAGHCSALIRVTGDLKDILMAHSSWFIYSSMLRIYKHYTLRVAAGHMTSASFSSYPGVLSSLDDFYMHDTGLVLLQTTNSIFNAELYRHTAPQSLLAWQRVRMANMAASGAEWGEVLAKHNSGTYNNQYMVVDLNRFVRGKALLNGLLTVVEQIPGDDGVIAEDMTDVLLMGYWPSFNVPFFHSIYNRSGSVGHHHGPSCAICFLAFSRSLPGPLFLKAKFTQHPVLLWSPEPCTAIVPVHAKKKTLRICMTLNRARGSSILSVLVVMPHETLLPSRAPLGTQTPSTASPGLDPILQRQLRASAIRQLLGARSSAAMRAR